MTEGTLLKEHSYCEKWHRQNWFRKPVNLVALELSMWRVVLKLGESKSHKVRIILDQSLYILDWADKTAGQNIGGESYANIESYSVWWTAHLMTENSYKIWKYREHDIIWNMAYYIYICVYREGERGKRDPKWLKSQKLNVYSSTTICIFDTECEDVFFFLPQIQLLLSLPRLTSSMKAA